MDPKGEKSLSIYWALTKCQVLSCCKLYIYYFWFSEDSFVVSGIISIFLMKKLMFREHKWFTQGHKPGNGELGVRPSSDQPQSLSPPLICFPLYHLTLHCLSSHILISSPDVPLELKDVGVLDSTCSPRPPGGTKIHDPPPWHFFFEALPEASPPQVDLFPTAVSVIL